MTITVVTINPQTGNEARVCMTSCPEEMVLRICGFWKRVSWDNTMEAESWVLYRWDMYLGFSDLCRQRSSTSQDVPCIGGGSNMLRIVFLSSCRHEPKSGINKPFVPETRESTCIVFVSTFVHVLYYCCDWHHYSFGCGIQHIFGVSCLINKSLSY